jgi:hypothetical protein
MNISQRLYDDLLAARAHPRNTFKNTLLSDSSISTYCLNVCDKKLVRYLLPLLFDTARKTTPTTAQ